MTSTLRTIILLVSIAPAFSACSVRPTIETAPLNFPRASTYDIVQKVRCEAKAGLDRFKNTDLEVHANQIIKATSIGYDFRFVMQEDNGLNGSVGFAGESATASKKPNGTLKLTGSAARTRKDIRSFRFVEDLADVAKADCSPQALATNLAYPISGALRVDDLAFSYVRLETLSDLRELRGADHGDVAIIDGDPRHRIGVFSEYLKFDTKVSLGATPSVALSASIGGFDVNSASLGASASRSDQHDVIIAFAQDPAFHSSERARAQRRKFTALYLNPIASQRREVRTPKLLTSLAQANAESRNGVILELARVRGLKDDEREEPKFMGQRLLTFLRPPDETPAGE